VADFLQPKCIANPIIVKVLLDSHNLYILLFECIAFSNYGQNPVRQEGEMSAMNRTPLLKAVLVAAIGAACCIGGCTKAPSKDDQSKLEEAKTAAESAEKKLYETKQERMRLETEKGKKEDVQSKGDDK
jgi:cell division protein FtsB